MKKIILDTSMIISYFIARKPSHIDQITMSIMKNEVELCASKETLHELKHTISTPDLRKYLSKNNQRVSRFVNVYQHAAHCYVTTDVALDFKLRDPTDAKFLQLAVASGAHYLITGDNDLLTIKKIGKTMILKPAEYCKYQHDNR